MTETDIYFEVNGTSGNEISVWEYCKVYIRGIFIYSKAHRYHTWSELRANLLKQMDL